MAAQSAGTGIQPQAEGEKVQVASNIPMAEFSFTPDGWVLGQDGQHVGRIDEVGHVWRLSGELLGRLDDQGYVRNGLGGVLGRIDDADLTSEAVRRQLWEWLAKD
jgi:hypothetical protein